MSVRDVAAGLRGPNAVGDSIVLTGDDAAPGAPRRRWTLRPRTVLAPAAIAMVVAGVVLARSSGHLRTAVLLAATVGAWTVAGTVIGVRRPAERQGGLILQASLIGALALLSSSVLWADADGRDLPALLVDGALLTRALAVALLPAAGMHLLLTLPDGACGIGRAAVRAGYVIATVTGLVLWFQRPSLPLWPVALEAIVGGAIGLGGSNRRYRRAAGLERQRMQWFGWARAGGAQVTVVALAVRLLSGWPDDGAAIAVAATLPIPVALALGSSPRLIGRVDTLLAHTVSLAGLSGVVVALYLVIVLGLSRTPTDEERPLLGLSMLAAAVAALLYLPARERLARFSNRLVYGEREAPDHVLKTFGSRLSRAIPLDELLLQVAESLKKTLALTTAEIWTGSEGRLDRTVSVPDAPVTGLMLGPEEEAVVTRAGVSGPAWVKVWLSGLLAGREGATLRVAPITHSGHLLGLIVAVRPATGEAFKEEEERILTELARQVGLALHNVQLDSALQSTLDEVRRQAEELRASRARIVAASDAARRQIERNLHDGAQQHLVALAVNVRLARQIAESDVEVAKQMLEQVGQDLQEAVQELRNLAHGIYPPLLVDRGLPEALSAAGGRAALPTTVSAAGIGRHSPEIEAAVYFCCLEAMQNAGKHAGDGATIRVRAWEEEGALFFEVADDGAGFDPSLRTEPGAGFVNMGDRVGAIGGTVGVQSAPGQGTRVSGRIPLPSGRQGPAR
ncbi:MAG TPA: histidine kinase [Acidimicrobiales bacterium]|nr:histidine kinase [Acidimicrobiales bacterium]